MFQNLWLVRRFQLTTAFLLLVVPKKKLDNLTNALVYDGLLGLYLAGFL